ncbi:MAG: type II secretion system protein [Planctomycetaceae bacterium]
MSLANESTSCRIIRRGFTLVELLVALGLVASFTRFAQVFQVATGAMSTQRGIMETTSGPARSHDHHHE